MDKLGIGVVRRVGKYDVYIGVIGLSLLLGCVAGAVTASFVEDIGKYFSPADELLSGFSFVSVLNRFLSLYKFHFMAAFLGFTLLGCFYYLRLPCSEVFLSAFQLLQYAELTHFGRLWRYLVGRQYILCRHF